MSCQVLRQFVDMSSNSSSKRTSRTSRQQVQQQQDPTAQLGFDYNAAAFDVPATTAAAASYDMSSGYSYDTFGATPDMSMYMPNAMTVRASPPYHHCAFANAETDGTGRLAIDRCYGIHQPRAATSCGLLKS